MDTAYNIGDILWTMDDGKPRSFPVMKIEIEPEFDCDYAVGIYYSEIDGHVHESECFRTKNEAIDAYIAEIRKQKD